MSTYAVGDLQGCLAPLNCLLQQVQFEPGRDCLWLVGDLVNRGPKSLETLRYLYSIRDSVTMVLGNHDLHLMATYYGIKTPKPGSCLAQIVEAPDAEAMIEWLRQQPLAHYDKTWDSLLVHAGIAPCWGVDECIALSNEVSQVIKDDQTISSYLSAMYGNTPARWDPSLAGMTRLRVITNFLTRMRFCHGDGSLNLEAKQGPENPPPGCYPWFELYNKKLQATRVIFGHWAALMGETGKTQFIGLDTGCVWGNKLTLLRLDDMHYFQCDCQ